MKLFSIVVFITFFFPKIGLAGSEVPAVGSVWESTSVYSSLPEDGSPPRRESEIFKVDRMQDGRPVFAGRMLGFQGEIIESTKGTIVYALECKNDVPEDMLQPPVFPNQCVGHVCSAPPVHGKPFVRATFIYVPMFGCQKQEGEYTFTPIRIEKYGDGEVTIGDAKFTFKGAPRAAWKSYIKKGIGEIFSESLVKVTTYDKVSVRLVPYQPSKAPVVAMPLAPQ